MMAPGTHLTIDANSAMKCFHYKADYFRCYLPKFVITNIIFKITKFPV